MSVVDILLLGWLAGCLITVVPTTRFVIRHIMDEEPTEVDPGEMAMAIVMAMTAVPFWPLYIPGFWIAAMVRTDRTAKRP